MIQSKFLLHVLTHFAVLVFISDCANAQPTRLRPPDTSDSAAQPFDADHSLNKLITGLVLESMPHSYSKTKDWGKQSERFDGIKFRREGWRIETKRRKKEVNHGTWRKYSAELMDPQNKFSVAVTNIHQTPTKQLGFNVSFKSRLKLFARQAKWVKGVQLYSFSAEGKAAVRLKVQIAMDIHLDPSRLPPDMVFRPKATAADIIVDDFRIDRISKVGGEVAVQVTRAARETLHEKVAEKEKELVVKINKEFEKKSDDLRLSLADAIDSQWSNRAMPFLPPAIKSVIDSAENK